MTDKKFTQFQQFSDQISTHTLDRSQGDYNIISPANTGIHRIIYGAARSPGLTSLIASTVDLDVVAQTYYSYSETYFLHSAQDQNEIVGIIAAHAPKWAESVISSPFLAAASSAFPGKKCQNRPRICAGLEPSDAQITARIP